MVINSMFANVYILNWERYKFTCMVNDRLAFLLFYNWRVIE